MATIIRSARIDANAVTLPAKARVDQPTTSGDAIRPGNPPPAAPPEAAVANVTTDHAKRELDELKFLRAQLRETEEALQSAKLRSQMEADEHNAKAYAEGFERGREEGRQAGLAAFEAQGDALVKVIESIARLDRQLMETAEDKLVEIVMASVCKIVGDFVADKTMVRAAVSHALNRVKGGKIGRIRLSRSDYEVISQLPAQELAGMDAIEFSPDDGITIGGCVLESDAGTLDCRLDAQLEQLKTLLLSVRREAE